MKTKTFLFCIIFNVHFFISSQETVFPNESTNMTLGTGYNSINGKDLDRCLQAELKSTTTLSGGLGANTFVTFEEIDTREELHEMLGLNSSASLGIGVFSGSTKAKFARNYDFSKHTYYLAVHVVVKNQSEVLNEYKLKSEIKSLLATKPDTFFQICGDTFIASRLTGGELLAIIKMETKNSTEKNKLTGSFKSKFTALKGISGSGSAGLSREITEIFKQHKGTVQILRRGGTSVLPEFWDPVSLKEYARNFPAEVSGEKGQPIVYSVTTKPYKEILDAADSEVVSLTDSRVVLNTLAKKHLEALSIHQDIEYIIANEEEFIDPNIQELETIDTKVVSVINKIRERAEACAVYPNEPSKCKLMSAEEVKLPKTNLPSRISGEYRVMRSKACGIEGYQMKKLPKFCRTPENGFETDETRTITFQTRNAFHSKKMGGEKQWLIHVRNYSNTLKKPFPKQQQILNNVMSPFCPQFEQNPGRGLDGSWKVVSSTASNVKQNNLETWNGWSGLSCDCNIVYERRVPKFDRNLACGYEEIPDLENPIYKECAHESHGYKEE